MVGLAVSITGSADAWVVPAEVARLRPPGTPVGAQMLYRFRSAATAAAVRADIAAVTAALPAGAVTATQSYLTIEPQDESHVAVYVPFLIAFGVIGLVMSLLIVVNVVSGAVVAGYTRIGIYKSIGFTPGQVTAIYVGRGIVPAAAAPRGPRQPPGARTGRPHRTTAGDQAAQDRSGPSARQGLSLLVP